MRKSTPYEYLNEAKVSLDESTSTFSGGEQAIGRALQSIAASNIAIAEYLKRLSEK